jgi:GTPase involved in cell partitioning and DNA repair
MSWPCAKRGGKRAGEHWVGKARNDATSLALTITLSVKLRSHSRITSLPLLVLFTRIDELEEKQVSRFERNIKQVMREQFAVLEAAEKTELEEEMNHLDHTLEGQSESRHIWSEWEVIVSSARSG